MGAVLKVLLPGPSTLWVNYLLYLTLTLILTLTLGLQVTNFNPKSEAFNEFGQFGAAPSKMALFSLFY